MSTPPSPALPSPYSLADDPPHQSLSSLTPTAINSHPRRTSSSHKPSLHVSIDPARTASYTASPPALPSASALTSHHSAWYLPFSTEDLPPISVFFFSCGHVLNDLCAACWFTYLLVMLREARHLMSWKSAMILLAGQVADAIATPLCGILSDRSKGLTFWRLRLERRQTWYLFGTILVAVNFFFIFGIALPVLIQPDCPEWGLLIYYCVAASLFNVGWAAVQVSHMAMVPELSENEHTRVVLNSARYSESVVANVAVFGILAFWSAVIYTSEGQYTFVAYTTLGIGLATSLVFLFGIREKRARRRKALPRADPLNALSSPLAAAPQSPGSPSSPKTPPSSVSICGKWNWGIPVGGWQMWLYEKDFYKVGWVYMNTRIVVNVSQVFLAFYVLDVLLLPTIYITIIPCVVYVCSFLAALAMKRVNKALGRKVITAIGGMFCVLALVLMYFLHPETAHLIYVPAVLLGIGNGTIMVMSTQLEADLIGRKTEHGAFVYGALSFTDKLANGVAIFLLQAGNADVDVMDDVQTSDAEYIRMCVVGLPFIAALLAMVMVMWGIDAQGMIERGNDVSQLGEEEEDAPHEQQGSGKRKGKEEGESGGGDAGGYKAPLFSGVDSDEASENGNGVYE